MMVSIMAESMVQCTNATSSASKSHAERLSYAREIGVRPFLTLLLFLYRRMALSAQPVRAAEPKASCQDRRGRDRHDVLDIASSLAW
jgi:hypothetical protein